MGAQLRVYRQKIRSAQTTKKITRAMELISASRIQKAQARMAASGPYARAVTRAVSAVATYSNVDHVLTTERENPTRAAVVVFTSDRGLAGAFSSQVIREANELRTRLEDEGREVVNYLVGRKAVSYFAFRRRAVEKQWTGNTDQPEFATAKEIADTLVEAFVRGGDNGGVDEIHIVYNRFVSLVTQSPEIVRVLPLEVVDGGATRQAECRQVGVELEVVEGGVAITEFGQVLGERCLEGSGVGCHGRFDVGEGRLPVEVSLFEERIVGSEQLVERDEGVVGVAVAGERTSQGKEPVVGGGADEIDGDHPVVVGLVDGEFVVDALTGDAGGGGHMVGGDLVAVDVEDGAVSGHLEPAVGKTDGVV